MVFSKALHSDTASPVARLQTHSLEEIRHRRIREWLPDAMAVAGVDLYVVFTREGAPDPLSHELGLGSAGSRAAGLFRVAANGDLERTAIVAKPYLGRVEASGCFDVMHGYAQEGIGPHLAQAIRSLAPRRIAVNTSRDVAIADGLTTGMREHLTELIGPDLTSRLVSSAPIVLSIFGRKFPEEIAAIERAVFATQAILTEALSSAVTQPGTTAGSIAEAIRRGASDRDMEVVFMTMRFGGRSPTGAAPEDVVRAGDLVSIDCGLASGGYCSDIQRTGYVLRNRETAAPDDLQSMWAVTLAAQDAAVLALQPNSTGLAVDGAARTVIQGAGFKEFPHAAGHSLGRRVHDVGPILGPAWPGYGSLVHSPIEPGQVFAVEPMVYAHAPSQGGEIRMGLEENVVVEISGPRLLGAPQRHLVLIA
jgi:Xaa-Pro aminopeptidase